MTFVKGFHYKYHYKLIELFFQRHLERALGYQFPALATLIYVDSEDDSSYLQVNGPPRALPSKSVDHKSADIEKT